MWEPGTSPGTAGPGAGPICMAGMPAAAMGAMAFAAILGAMAGVPANRLLLGSCAPATPTGSHVCCYPHICTVPSTTDRTPAAPMKSDSSTEVTKGGNRHAGTLVTE